MRTVARTVSTADLNLRLKFLSRFALVASNRGPATAEANHGCARRPAVVTRFDGSVSKHREMTSFASSETFDHTLGSSSKEWNLPWTTRRTVSTGSSWA